jgi:hypothetical protein
MLYIVNFFLFEYWGCGVHTGSTQHCGHYWPIVPAPGDCEDWEVGGMNGFGRANRNTLRKLAPTPLCPPQIPFDQIRARTRAAAVGRQRLTASSMARPIPCKLKKKIKSANAGNLREAKSLESNALQKLVTSDGVLPDRVLGLKRRANCATPIYVCIVTTQLLS